MGEIHQYPSDISREEYNLIREDLEGAKNNPAQKTGIKRHVIVDTRGLPHAITVTTADVTDRDRAIQMILLNLDNLSHVEKFLVDAGYFGQRFANQGKDICGAQIKVVKRSEFAASYRLSPILQKITLPVRRRSRVSQAGFCLVPIVLFVPVKGVDLRHFRIGQLEAVQFGVLLDMVGIAGAGDDYHTLLQIPPQDNLGGGYAVGFGDTGDHFISQQLRRMTTASQGIPALDYDPKVLDIGDHIVLLIVGVDFILNQSRGNRHLG